MGKLSQIKKLILILFFVFSLSLKPQDVLAANNASFYKSIASFVHNFPKMIKNRDGVLCVYGYDQVSVIIEEKYSNNTVFFKDDKDLNNLKNKNCKLLYISKNHDKALSQIMEAVNRFKVVSIGLDDHFIENGGTILVQIGRRNFELIMNYRKVKEYEIRFDPVVSNLLVD